MALRSRLTRPLAQVPIWMFPAAYKVIRRLHTIPRYASNIYASQCPSNNSHAALRRMFTTQGEMKPLRVEWSVAYIPHPDKVDRGGEDGHFIANTKRAAGVADGVGSWWVDEKIDAGIYARRLMEETKKAVERITDVRQHIDPLKVLKAGYDVTSQSVKQGSSTACVVAINGCTLDSINVGDSGYVVFRNGVLLFESTPTTHGYNCPVQLGNAAYDKHHRGYGDVPEDGAIQSVQLEPGDVIIMGSDGLFDNLKIRDIYSLISGVPVRGVIIRNRSDEQKFLTGLQDCPKKKPEALANAIAISARYVVESPNLTGKLDDITVIAGVVAEA